MKNNKGFSLVELLVAIAVLGIVMAEIGTLVLNCSSLYQRGTLEAELQTEAQRATQIIEELVVDADVSVNAVASATVTGSDEITIKRKETTGEVTYKIYVANISSKGYGDLMISDGSSVEKLAEFVKAVKLDTSKVNTSDTVTLGIELFNGKSTYGSASNMITKDFYLRNRLGTGFTSPTTASSENNIEIEVLRYDQIDIDDYVDGIGPYTYVESSGPTTKLYDVTSDGVVTPETVLNLDFNRKEKETRTKVDAYADDGTVAFSVTLYSVPVEVGMSKSSTVVGTSPECKGEYYVYGCYANAASTPVDSFILVKGITVKAEALGLNSDYTGTAINKHGTWANMSAHNSSGDHPLGSANFQPKTTNTYSFGDVVEPANTVVTSGDVKLQDCFYYLDVDTNSIVVYSQLYFVDSDSAKLTKFYDWCKADKNNKAFMDIVLAYGPSTASAPEAKLNVRAFFSPLGEGDSNNLGNDHFENVEYDKKPAF